jgi:N-acetylmuramoyl-L-alanine amidase
MDNRKQEVFSFANKILALFFIISLLIAIPIAAQKKKVVLLKFNKQDSLLRVVFEGEEAFINKIKVTTSSSQIRMEFPEAFDLKSQKDLPFEIIPSEKMVVINLKEKVEIKFFRLSAPARLVLDIQKKEPQAEKQAEKQQGKQPEQQTPVTQTRGIVIDAGHGGYDFGITYGNINEKDISLSLARDLGAALSKKGKKVFLIRKADQYVSLSDRIHFVNQRSPDIFISLHASMSRNFILYEPTFDEQGSHEYSLASSQKKYAGKSKVLSDSIEKAIKDEFKDEIIRRGMPLPLLISVEAPSVFIEYPSPEIVSYDQQMKTRLINSIIHGITAYGL